MKSVLISLQPKWCELIASGKKTIEVRKTAPKLETPFKCYIYQTKALKVNKAYSYKTWARNGKVIGEFVCEKIEKFNVGSLRSDVIEKLACLTYNEIINYFYKPEELDGKTVKVGYAWHISNLKIYDKPKELGEFYRCQCKYMKRNPNLTCDCYCELGNQSCFENGGAYKPLTRAPRSWQFVEEISE